MLKVMTLVGTRPELIKMSRVIAEFDQRMNHVLVHSGQNYDYELNEIFFRDLEIRKPDYFLGVTGNTPSKAIADVIAKTDDLLTEVQPDAILLYGDTNTCMAVIAAKRHKIPVFHMEAGNRCFDQRVPEELNRKVLDHLSDINLVLTEHARRYLIAEGISPQTIFKTGSHMQEVLDYYMPKIERSNVLTREGLKERRFIIVSAHREENVDDTENLKSLLDAIDQLAEHYDMPIIVSTHPRTRKRMELLESTVDSSLVYFMKPFGFLDYIKMQMSAFCILSDSGTITEEASLLNLPAITIRNAHERPEGMDVGTLVMSGLKPDRILQAVKLVTSQHIHEKRISPIILDYAQPSVSKQITRIVQSYTDYINRLVWHKPGI